MENYILSCCSTVDVDKDRLDSRNISYISMHYFLAGREFDDDFGNSISYSEFYQTMRDGADTKTSQISSGEYEDYFRKILSSGSDLIHITLSSGLSGCFNSAKVASESLKKEFPKQKIIIIDSLGASSGYGLIMDKLADLRDEGYSIDQLANWSNEHVLELHHWFFSTDLTYYVRGGRISKASGWFGTLFKICPLLNMSIEGKLVPRKKVRGKFSVIKAIVDEMDKHAQSGTEYDQKCYICHSDCVEDAEKVQDLVLSKFHNVKEVSLFNIGTTIGSHTGPGTVALFFWGDKRVD